MDCLSGLLKFAGYLGWAFTIDEEAADGFLFFGEADGGMFEGCFCHVFQFAIFTTPVIIEIDRREEPSINHPYTRYPSRFHQMHKVPVTEVKLFRRFVRGQHPIEVLQIIMQFIAPEGHV